MHCILYSFTAFQSLQSSRSKLFHPLRARGYPGPGRPGTYRCTATATVPVDTVERSGRGRGPKSETNVERERLERFSWSDTGAGRARVPYSITVALAELIKCIQ